nr:MAG TPA: hypothetical protein [Caudoviricetes sp.]
MIPVLLSPVPSKRETHFSVYIGRKEWYLEHHQLHLPSLPYYLSSKPLRELPMSL